MTIFFFLSLLVLGLSAIWLGICKLTTMVSRLLQGVKEQTPIHLQERDTEIGDSPEMLELQKLEEEMRRKEGVLRLRTVLTEKLLR